MLPSPHPDFSGWRVCVYAGLTQALAIGFTLGAVGLFAAPVGEEFGITATGFNLGVGGFTLVMNLSMPVIGRFIDRGSIRNVMALGALVLAVSLFGLAIANAVWQVALCWIVGCALGMAMLGPMPSSTAMANWFDRQRGRAIGFANVGAPAGPLVIVPAAALAFEPFGWRPVLGAFAAAALFVALPAARFGMLDRPGDVGQFPDGDAPADGGRQGEGTASGSVWDASSLVRSRAFWMIALGAAIFGGQGIVVGANSIPFLQHRGASIALSGTVPIAMGVGAIAGPLIFGPMADRVHPRTLFMGLCALISVAFGALLLPLPIPALLGLLVVCGLVGGSMMPVYGAALGRLFGVDSFGLVMGLGALVAVPVGAGAPIAFGYAFDATGSYTAGFIGLMIAMAIAAAFFSAVPIGEAAHPAPRSGAS